MMRDIIRTYSELQDFDTLEDRFAYLELGGTIGESTFGFDRWINQRFYRSREWRRVREHVIARDDGLDLGTHDVPVRGAHLIHHMNPITLEDFEKDDEAGYDHLLEPEFLITTALRTHNAIHFGNKDLLPQPYVERRRGDHIEW